MKRLLAPLALLAALAACAPPADPTGPALPTLANHADSVAMRIYTVAGGPAVWSRVPYLRFDFGARADTAQAAAAAPRRHLWNRTTGDYRLEMPRGDTLYTALFNVGTRAGHVYRNTAPLDSAAEAAWLERAYHAFINDTYWLLVPTKLFDEGVAREYVADSSNADREVISLHFGNVGLTPGDRYWLYASRATGALEAWGFVLEGNPDAPPSYIPREEVETLETPYGTAQLATAHRVGGGRTLYTDAVALPQSVDAALFTDPAARME